MPERWDATALFIFQCDDEYTYFNVDVHKKI